MGHSFSTASFSYFTLFSYAALAGRELLGNFYAFLVTIYLALVFLIVALPFYDYSIESDPIEDTVETVLVNHSSKHTVYTA
ncbi:unnamed protein product [Protopolystoma xenopodis]|uniref:Uncharacterized protein n=1 Tax=Protopolystoma xenopodis TaxID=117903 RepID=A0A3S5FFL6_9PLAT|nr:unnamed protein product [Protopolystoma xenopodis]